MKKYTIKKYPTKTNEGKDIIEHVIYEQLDKNTKFLYLKTVGHTMPKTLKSLKLLVKSLNDFDVK